MTALFVTATGTDVGKTFVTAGLIRQILGTGRPVDAIKPVVSGFDPAAWQDSDPAALLAALGRPVALDEAMRISPWRFKAPLDFSRSAIAQRRGTLLIEGIGGIMVPLDDHRTVLDLISLLRIPIILVAGTYVGTISHTLTSLEVLVRRNLNVAVVVVSESAGSAAGLEDTVATVQRFADSIDVVGVPRLAPGAGGHAAFARIAALI
jgi:dethiobiotin synthetase